MSDMVKYKDNGSTVVGKTMIKTGAIGGGLWLAAGILPFITFPMLLILLIVGGGLAYMKGLN